MIQQDSGFQSLLSRWPPLPHLTIAGFLVLLAGGGYTSALTLQQRSINKALRPAFLIDEWETDEGVDFVANPASIAISADREIFVLDAGNHRVAVFSANGTFMRSFGRAGEGPGEFALGRLYRSADISVQGERVIVLDPLTRRVSFFSRGGELEKTFALAQSPQSLTSNEGRVYLRVSGYTSEASAEILLVDVDAESSEAELFSAPLLSGNGPGFARFNRSAIAVAPDGRLMQAYSWWPVLRLHRANGESDEKILLHEWWPKEDISTISRVADAFEAARDDGAYPTEISRSPFFDDVEYIAKTNSWVGLAKGNVYFFDDRRSPTESIDLLPSEGVSNFGFFDIGIDPEGTLLCGADPVIESKVACYELAAR